MRKVIVISLGSFVLGIAATAFVMTNPFHWVWIHELTGMLMSTSSESTDDDAPEQLWTCGMHPQVLQEEPGDCPICGMRLVPVKETQTEKPTGKKPEGEREIKYWRAPMDPTYISDEPGKSPMGMDLIPVYEGEEEDIAPGTIKIDPVFVQNIGVVSEEIERTDIPFTIRTVGSLSYDNSQIAIARRVFSPPMFSMAGPRYDTQRFGGGEKTALRPALVTS